MQRDGDTSGVDESFVPGPSGGRGGSRQGSECPARVLAEALSKIAPSNESDTQSILGIHRIIFFFLIIRIDLISYIRFLSIESWLWNTNRLYCLQNEQYVRYYITRTIDTDINWALEWTLVNWYYPVSQTCKNPPSLHVLVPPLMISNSWSSFKPGFRSLMYFPIIDSHC